MVYLSTLGGSKIATGYVKLLRRTKTSTARKDPMLWKFVRQLVEDALLSVLITTRLSFILIGRNGHGDDPDKQETACQNDRDAFGVCRMTCGECKPSTKQKGKYYLWHLPFPPLIEFLQHHYSRMHVLLCSLHLQSMCELLHRSIKRARDGWPAPFH